MAIQVSSATATNLTASTDLNALNSVAGRSSVLIGGTEAGYGSIKLTNMFKVGAVDGTVSVANNQEIVKLQSSALQNPYAAINTAYDFQVNFTLQEVDLPNIAMSLGLKASDSMIKAIEYADLIGTTGGSPGGESAISIALSDDTPDMQGTNVTSAAHGLTASDVGRKVALPSAAGQTYEIREIASITDVNVFVVDTNVSNNGEVDAGTPVYKSAWMRKFDLDAASPGPYKSMRIVTLGAQNTDGTVEHMGWDFYKVKIVSQGTVDFDRTAAISLPVTAHCLGNSSDVVGRVWHTNVASVLRGYPG
jgi:hypothetical protein